MRRSFLAVLSVVVLAASLRAAVAGEAKKRGIEVAPPPHSVLAETSKLALVIGVSDYDRDKAALAAAEFVTLSRLPNAVADAQIVADALSAQGFRVTRLMNPDKRAMLAALNQFAKALHDAGPAAEAIFYFAGHGAQGRPALERDIDNYLIPLGADLATEVDLDSEAVGLRRLSAMLQPGRDGAVVLILDACRNFALPTASRSGVVTRGLAEARAAPGTVIAYATSPGSVAVDGPPGRNGPYARELAAQLRAAAGKRLEDVFINVRNAVYTETSGMQLPWENGSLRRAVVIGTPPAVPKERAAPLRLGSCENLVFDVETGLLSGLPPNLSREEVKRELPCFTGETAEGELWNHGGGVFFLNLDIYYYTFQRYLEVRSGFNGRTSIPLFGRTRAELRRALPFADEGDRPGWANKFQELVPRKWGCLILEFDDTDRLLQLKAFSVGCKNLRDYR
jgi:hypothetical protein